MVRRHPGGGCSPASSFFTLSKRKGLPHLSSPTPPKWPSATAPTHGKPSLVRLCGGRLLRGLPRVHRRATPFIARPAQHIAAGACGRRGNRRRRGDGDPAPAPADRRRADAVLRRRPLGGSPAQTDRPRRTRPGSRPATLNLEAPKSSVYGLTLASGHIRAGMVTHADLAALHEARCQYVVARIVQRHLLIGIKARHG